MCRLISACSSVLRHTATFFQTNTVPLASLDLLRSAAQLTGLPGTQRSTGQSATVPIPQRLRSHDREPTSACEAYIALEGPVATTSAPAFCSSCLQAPLFHQHLIHAKLIAIRFEACDSEVCCQTLYAPPASSIFVECRTSTRKSST